MRIRDWSSDVFSSDLTLWDPTHVQILHGQGETFRDHFDGMEEVGLSKKTDVLYTAGFESRAQPFGFSYLFTEGAASTEQRRVGKECVSPCRARCSPSPS